MRHIYRLCAHLFPAYFQARKFRKHVFEITVDPKGPPIEPTFWLGLEVPDPLAPPWRPRPFPAKNNISFKKVSQALFLDWTRND